MRKFIVFAVVLFLAAGSVYAKGHEIKKKAGEFDVTVAFDKKTPTASDNAVNVVVKDAAGNIVKDAKVVIDYSMPAMVGMPPMNYKADALLQGDEYKATLGLSMSGSWNITVRITRAGKTASMKFTVDAK